MQPPHQRQRQRHALCLLLLLALALCGAVHGDDASFSSSSSVTPSPITSRGTGDGFLRARLPATDVYGASAAENALLRALRDAFPTASDVQSVSLREEELSFAGDVSVDPPSTFLLVFLVGRDPRQATSALPPLAINATALQSELRARLLTDAVARLVLAPDAANALEVALLSASAAAALGPFPSLDPVDTSPPLPPRVTVNGASVVPPFLRVDVSYRNLLAPRNLSRALVYATRRGITRFLGLSSVASVVAAGPPAASTASVLLVSQTFLVVVAGGANGVSRDVRERLASLLLYGDASRLVTPASSSDPTETARPALFLDVVTTPSRSTLPPLDPLVLLTLPFVFSSLAVDAMPPGNPPEPPAPAPAPGVVSVAATPSSELLLRLRKTQRFALDDVGNAALRADQSAAGASNGNVALDTSAMACPSDRFCAHVVWRNALPATRFWVERLESVERLAWNRFPNVPLCVAPTVDALNANGAAALVAPTTLAAPIVRVAPAPDDVWTFSALAAPLHRLEWALHLRSVDDDGNATALQVELSVDWRSSSQVASTVTSIARRRQQSTTSTTSTTTPSVPVYETPSNVVVTYESRVRSANELLLLLDVRRSSVTRKDTSQPCANCQNLFDWCNAQPKCAALATCVVRDGLETAQVPVNLLLATDASQPQSQDVSSFFRACLPTAADPNVDVDALLLFTSAVRCQLQRLCPFRSTASYGLGSSSGAAAADRVVRWEQSAGVLALEVSALPPTAGAAITATLRLLSTPLCSFPLHAAVSSAELEDWIPRQCRFANYLGRVRVALSFGVDATSSSGSPPQQRVDRVEFRFDGLVGPLPTLDVASSTATTGARVVVASLPVIRLRAETLDAITALPVPPPSPAASADVCQSTCRRLALDGCLRDPLCVAYTDCITRFALPSSPSTASPPLLLGDAILDLFERAAVGETLSFAAAVAQCSVSDDVARASWRRLVAASACYAQNACPISLALLVPQTANAVVGKWVLSPVVRVQRLIYQQQSADDSSSSNVIPLSLSRQETNGTTTVVTTASSSFDAADLTDKLRRLLEFDGITARLDSDTNTQAAAPSTSLRVVQWTVEYSYWVGALPMFIAASESPRWLLAALPSTDSADGAVASPDCVLSMVAPPPTNATASDGSKPTSSLDALAPGVTTTTVQLSAAA
ncbi:hypothetical protein PINS_up006594 [Pythium insidiosum]|nr:hypothetical protein PINS_up006594 [Pythium insidiosum]